MAVTSARAAARLRLILRRILILLLAVVRRRRRLLLVLLLLILLLVCTIRRRNLMLLGRRLSGLLSLRLMLLLRLYGLLWDRRGECYGDSTIDTKFRDRYRLAMAVGTDRKILRIGRH